MKQVKISNDLYKLIKDHKAKTGVPMAVYLEQCVMANQCPTLSRQIKKSAR